MTPDSDRPEAAPVGYDPRSFPARAVTVDLVVLAFVDGDLSVLLVRRGEPPFEDRWALPGGFVRDDEDLEDAARRELREETGVDAVHLEQLRAYGSPDRDPRMRVITIAFVAVIPIPDLTEPVAASDADDAEWIPIHRVLPGSDLVSPDSTLAFDHARILSDIERVRSQLETSALGTAFLGTEFTISALRAVYEQIWGAQLDPGNFRRSITANAWLEPTGQRVRPSRHGGKPAELFTYRSTGPPASAPAEPPLRRPRSRPQDSDT